MWNGAVWDGTLGGMILTLVDYLEEVIQSFGAWGVFVGAFIEEVIAPLPSPLVMTASGFFLLDGPFSLELVGTLILLIAIPYAIGVTLGSFILYGVVYVFGEPVIRTWGRWFDVSWERIESIRMRLDRSRWDEVTLFALRVVPLVPSAGLAALCGLVRMRFLTYALITFVGVGVRASLFAVLGWYVGGAYRRYAETVAGVESYIVYGILAIAVALLVYAFVRAQVRRRGYGILKR